jgi:hypothetical protein
MSWLLRILDDDDVAADQAKAAIVRCQTMFTLNSVRRVWEDQMKALAAERLHPGCDEPITDLDALDYIWDLPGDCSWSSEQTEPFRPHALDYYVGRTVEHVWGTGTIEKMAAGYGIRVWLPCAYCEKAGLWLYARPGCHTGAFCYLYDEQGQYALDLRNQIFVCPDCQGTHIARRKQLGLSVPDDEDSRDIVANEPEPILPVDNTLECEEYDNQ